VKPAPFSYLRPQGLQHALEALAADPGAKVLAGGQSLVPLLSMRLAAPSSLVDINGLPDLDHVRVDASGVRVGALARHADVLASDAVRRVQPLVSLALSHVAHATIRNRGTTVGSIVHADAAAEMPMVLALLGGSLTVASTAGTRTIPASELFAGPLESTLRHDEVALEAFFPPLGPAGGVGFAEIARRHGDYALVGVGAVVEVEGGSVTSARLGYLSVSDVPTVVDVTSPLVEEGALRPSRDRAALSDDALSSAGDLALTALDPADDLHATAAYRAHLVRVLTSRVLAAAYDDALTRAGSTP
jgi:carbon-monoxide dehydrogenase medium subunit